MNAESLEVPSATNEGLPLFRFVSTFWGLTAVVLLAIFTLVNTLNHTPAQAVSRSAAVVAAEPEKPHISPFANFVAPPAPPLERLGPVIYINCGGTDVQTRSGAPGRYPITMRLDQVPDDIRAVLSGTDTVFPKDTPVYKTTCIQQKIESGELP